MCVYIFMYDLYAMCVQVVDMAHYILKREGLWMGSSSALNLVACCKYAFEMRRHEAEAAGDLAYST